MDKLSLSIKTIEEIFVYLPVAFTSYFIFIRAININTKIKTIIYFFISSSILSTIVVFTQSYNYILSKLLFFSLFILSLFVYVHNKKMCSTTIPTAIISIGISYCIKAVSIFLCSFICWIIDYGITNIYTETLMIILHLLLTFIVINIKRIKRGFCFFYNVNNLGIGIIISGFVLIVITLGGQNYVNNSVLTILLIGIFISTLGLFIWIRKSITEHYRKKLQAKADEHYQNTLAEKEQQIEQLNNSNSFLSKIVHRDNHIMSSLQHTITKYKVCDNPSEKEKLMNEILTLAQERSDLIVKEQANTKVLPTTGISLIDGALSNMYIKATAHHIDFNLIINQDIHYLVNNLITQTDLETLLCDHIKDAIIAINSGEVIKGKILVTITMNDDIYEISIMDNGVDFEVDTLAKLGLERVTTHKDTGGSGIGFMTTFETLKKSNVSLIITENKTKTPFSKSITFRFDGLNAFIINSYRADLLKQSINRNDIIIM